MPGFRVSELGISGLCLGLGLGLGIGLELELVFGGLDFGGLVFGKFLASFWYRNRFGNYHNPHRC